jgi:hypothetical protein
MKQFKNTIFYVLITGGFSSLIYWILSKGKLQESGRNIKVNIIEKDQWTEFSSSFLKSLQEPLAILLLQIITIIIVARFFGWIFRKIGQPSVIGEMIAGIVLGPSVVGLYFPEYFC